MKALGLEDAHVVLRASDWTAERHQHRLAHALDGIAGALAVEGHLDRRPVHRRGLVEGGVEDLEKGVAVFASPDARAPPRSTPFAPPFSIACASRASQFPSGEFGDPTKLQPQPGSQLHASRYVPAIRQVLT
jgi:hypothetical protein